MFRLGTGYHSDGGNVQIKKLAETLRDRSYGIGGICLPLRSPQMRGKDDSGPSLTQVLNRWYGSTNAAVVSHFAVPQRHIEIDPNQCALSPNLYLGDRPFRHGSVLRLRTGNQRVRLLVIVGVEALLADEGDDLGDTAGVGPLVVVPGQDFDKIVAESHGR